jgi:aspartyl-tRNA(Asn)/glutamyl-tRNA(Gln) amidotransferase subunit B
MDENKIKYEAVIGLEIHAELKTQSKMFCSCANSTTRIYADENFNEKSRGWKNEEQNMNVCPVCLGMPGMLPVLNKQAIEWTILTGLALNCEVAKLTKWDRKNYFYPDLPKGYQISQYDLPLVFGGFLEINNKKIGITRIHLEEDTGTSKHPEGRTDVDYSLMDYNRAGVPLMELVTEPEITSASEAKEFCQKYQLILRYLGVADADMEKGQMRCEANISVKPIGQKEFGTKVEVKNLNSFKSVEKAIEYEINRQTSEIEDGGKIIQETRGWDDAKNKTYTMRVKETSADYRYFPEPDLPAVRLVRGSTRTKNADLRGQNQIIDIDEIKRQLPELPDVKVGKYINNYKIDENIAKIIVSSIDRAIYFESIIELDVDPILVSNWVVNELSDMAIKPEYIKFVAEQIQSGKISKNIAKDLWVEIRKGKSPQDVIKEKGLEQISDSNELEKIVNDVLSKNPEIVNKIKSGQNQVIGFLVGQIMKESKGQANPKVVNELLNKKLK